MARKRIHEDGEKRNREYNRLYEKFESLAMSAAEHFGRDRRASITVVNAQAAVLVATLLNYTLSTIPQKEHATYLHWLFSQMMKDVTKGRPMKGGVVIREGR